VAKTVNRVAKKLKSLPYRCRILYRRIPNHRINFRSILYRSTILYCRIPFTTVYLYIFIHSLQVYASVPLLGYAGNIYLQDRLAPILRWCLSCRLAPSALNIFTATLRRCLQPPSGVQVTLYVICKHQPPMQHPLRQRARAVAAPSQQYQQCSQQHTCQLCSRLTASWNYQPPRRC
jgi:hypothetical protein